MVRRFSSALETGTGTLEPWNPGTCSWVEKLLIKCLFINVFTVRSAAIIGAAWEVKHIHHPSVVGCSGGKRFFQLANYLSDGWETLSPSLSSPFFYVNMV